MKVVMKMGIKFSEFLVFPDLLTSGCCASTSTL